MPEKRYFACKVAQRGEGNSVEFAVFIASAKEVMKWAGVRRVGEHQQGTQRILRDTRVRSIERFFTEDRRNTIPTSVLVAFNAGSAQFITQNEGVLGCFPEVNLEVGSAEKTSWGTLSFNYEEDLPDHERPALIVDGQHRLKGMAEIDEDVPVLVAALINASVEEQAFQFVVINNKSSKVPTDNVKAIISNFNETETAERLARAGINYGGFSATLLGINNSEDSPFYRMLDWPLNPQENRKVNLTTIEACLRYLRSQVPIVDDDEDTQRQIFSAIWSAVKTKYNDVWANNERFMSKVSMNALNEFIVDRLEYAWEGDLLDIFDPDQISVHSTNILDAIPSRYWSTSWTYPLQDNVAIRNMIKEDFKTMSQNRRTRKHWHQDLKLIGEVQEDR